MSDFKHRHGTMMRDLEELREAIFDLTYEVLRLIGVIGFLQRRGRLSRWAQERYDFKHSPKPEPGE